MRNNHFCCKEQESFDPTDASLSSSSGEEAVLLNKKQELREVFNVKIQEKKGVTQAELLTDEVLFCHVHQLPPES